MKEKNELISNRDITDYIKSKRREDLLNSFITHDTQELIKDFPKWNDTQRVLGYLDSLVRYSDGDRVVFYEHNLLANRGEMVSRCKVCGLTLYKVRKGFINIRSELRAGKRMEQIREDTTIISVYATLKNTQKEYYHNTKREWIEKVRGNLEERKNSRCLSHDENETLTYLNGIIK